MSQRALLFQLQLDQARSLAIETTSVSEHTHTTYNIPPAVLFTTTPLLTNCFMPINCPRRQTRCITLSNATKPMAVFVKHVMLE